MTQSRSLMLFRGLPGSGKTTMARAFVKGLNTSLLPWERITTAHFEADDFFCKTGKYCYEPALVHAAHLECLLKTQRAMQEGTQIIVVANTFVRLWELDPYHKLAIRYNYPVQEIIVTGNFPNQHGVPVESIARMQRHFQMRPKQYILGDPLVNPADRILGT